MKELETSVSAFHTYFELHHFLCCTPTFHVALTLTECLEEATLECTANLWNIMYWSVSWGDSHKKRMAGCGGAQAQKFYS